MAIKGTSLLNTSFVQQAEDIIKTGNQALCFKMLPLGNLQRGSGKFLRHFERQFALSLISDFLFGDYLSIVSINFFQKRSFICTG